MPALAEGFSARPETAPGVGATLIQGTSVVLVPGRPGGDGARDWPASCGMTQIAVHLAETVWHSREVDLLVWVTASSRASVLAGYVEAAAAALGADPAGDAESVASRLTGWLTETTRPWLVVLDDLTDPADLEGLWPGGPTGRVLITTPSQTTLPAESLLSVLPVGPFSPRESLGYLMGRLTADPDQRLGAIDLVKDLNCEPLALAQASSVIASSALSCRDYRDYFVRRRDHLADASGNEPAAASVTWTFSVEQADRLSPDGAARSALALGAVLDGNAIPGAVFATPAACGYLPGGGIGTPADQERVRAALLVLERAGLLTIEPGDTWPTIRMSQAVLAATRSAMPAEMMEQAVRVAADALLEAWPEEEGLPWLASDLRSCAAALQRTAGDLLWTGGCHPLLLRAGRSLDAAHMAGPAVMHWRELVAASDRILGPGHQDTLVAGEQLANACLAAGRAPEAVPWFQWVLTRRLRALGPEHSGTLAARRSLGHALVAANQHGDAVTALDTAVGDYERVHGTDHLETLDARDELAAAYYAAGQAKAAIQLGQRTLAGRERIQGAQHPDTMTTRQKLADAYLAAGRRKEALAGYKRVLADRERVLGPDHLDTIAARGALGSAYHSAGRMASALQLYEETRDGYERVLGADHADTLAYRANLANAYYAAGRLTDATTLLRDTAARCERALPAGDPLTQSVKESLTNIAG
ncbi:MAG TPA: tetratricopeptide repeat protein [Streptosporangiaceae bacterium]